jgi:ANTAR domain
MPPRTGDVVGQFRWDAATETVSWSTGVFALHGYPPAAITPSIDLVLAHKVPEDRERTALLMASVRDVDRDFSNYHRLVDVAGHERVVLTVGSSRLVRPGPDRPLGGRVSTGFMADVTEEHRQSTREAVLAAHEHGATIHQAQGAMMALYGLNENAALSLLRWYSQNHNIKIAVLAERVVAQFDTHKTPITREGMDRILFDQATAKARVPEPAMGSVETAAV